MHCSVAVCAVAVLLAGCAPAAPPAATASAQSAHVVEPGAAGPRAAPALAKTDSYLAVVHAVMPKLPRERAVVAGHVVCAALDTAPDLPHYAAAISAVAHGQQSRVLAAKTLVDAAIEAFCPRRIDLAARFAAAQQDRAHPTAPR